MRETLAEQIQKHVQQKQEQKLKEVSASSKKKKVFKKKNKKIQKTLLTPQEKVISHGLKLTKTLELAEEEYAYQLSVLEDIDIVSPKWHTQFTEVSLASEVLETAKEALKSFEQKEGNLSHLRMNHFLQHVAPTAERLARELPEKEREVEHEKKGCWSMLEKVSFSKQKYDLSAHSMRDYFIPSLDKV